MAAETKTALLFPGQGLPPKDAITCYQRLNNIDPTHVKQRLGQMQEAINRYHGTTVLDISTALQDEKFPSYRQTAFVQPVVYALSVLAAEINDTYGPGRIFPSFVAGHSLGEYSALTRTGVIDFEEGVDLVTYRGMVMEEECQRTKSVLLRISSTEGKVRDICQPRGNAIAQIALINAPTLIVVGCGAEVVPEIDRLAREAGTRATDLGTAGAFHTIYMAKPASQLAERLLRYQFKDPQIPVVANLTGEPETSGLALKQCLAEGMIKPVQWAKTLATLQSRGIVVFGEVGPGTSLARLNEINGIKKTIDVLNDLTS